MNSKKTILAKPSLPQRGTSPKKGEKNIVILALETSCDETAAAVLSVDLSSKNWPETKTLSSIVKSQIALHSKMGGVVPEAAARAHIKNIRPVVEKALSIVKGQLSKVDYIAVTAGPGLMPSLLVGVEFAKGLSLALNKPLIPVNHMAGHLYSPFSGVSDKGQGLRDKSLFPNISLIVSGGHTMIVVMENEKKYKVIGQTVDDAAGEAFDKVAKLLKLPYPGGPEVSRLAEKGNPNAIAFPRPMLTHKNYNFSFSGLKTAVLYHVKSLVTSHLSLATKSDICASFQAAVVEVLVQKTMRAVKEYKAKSVSLSGGVSANRSLREMLKVNCQLSKVAFLPAPLSLSGDNAEMIGLAAGFMLHNGFKPVSFKQVKADSNLEL